MPRRHLRCTSLLSRMMAATWLALALALVLGVLLPSHPALADPIFGARVSHMTVPQGADAPKLSVEYWPYEDGMGVPALKPGQEAMALRDGASGRQYQCILPNISALGLPADEGDEEQPQQQEQQQQEQGGSMAALLLAQSQGSGQGQGQGQVEAGQAVQGKRARKGVQEGETRKTPEQILDVMKGLPCAYKMDGWWTYEFCYKDKIRQLHFEPAGDNKLVITMEFVLGLYNEELTRQAQHKYEAEFGALSPEEQAERKKYFVQVYDRGTPCDLTQEKRQTQVRYFCEHIGKEQQQQQNQHQQQQQQQQKQKQHQQHASYIKSLKEAPTCHYEMHFMTTLLCAHREFKKAQRRENVINCYEVPEDTTPEEGALEEGTMEEPGLAEASESPVPSSASAPEAASQRGTEYSDEQSAQEEEGEEDVLELIPEDEEVRELEEELVAL